MMNENKVRLGKRITPSANNLMAYLSCGTLCIAHCSCNPVDYKDSFSIDRSNTSNLDQLIVYSR